MAIKITKDGRTIRTGKDYTNFRYGLYEDQGGRCAECGSPTDILHPLEWDYSFHVDHTNGRGMGGSRRDDTLKSCTGKCGRCHRRKHGQGM